MQAIILAAGMGRPMGYLTKDVNKCMLEINGISLIDRLLCQLSAFELNRVIIVVGYQAQKLKDYIGNRYYKKLNIEYVFNPQYETTNNVFSLSLVKNQLQEDDTILIESHMIYEDGIMELLLNDRIPNLALVAKYQTWMDGVMVRIDDDNNIVNFIPENAFEYSDTQFYYKTANIYKFSKEFSSNTYVPFLEAYCKSIGNNEYYEQVLRVVTLLKDPQLKAVEITDKKWYEIIEIQDVEIAETLFAEGEERLNKYISRFGGLWRFPGILDSFYLVNPYYPTPRLEEELAANFKTLLTEYPSGMKINSLLAAEYFNIKKEYVLPGNGAAEVIKALMEILPGKMGALHPTFEEYSNRRNSDELEIFVAKNKDFHYSAHDLIDYFSNHPVNSLVLVNPDNPSGNFIPLDDLCVLANWCLQKGTTLIIDESFVDFSEGCESNTLLRNDILESYSNLVVIKSISKSYGVPGLRLGVLASGNINLINNLKKYISIWNINSFAEFYMQIFPKYRNEYKKSCEKFQIERKWMYAELNNISFLRVIPSQANYFLAEVLKPLTSHALVMKALDYNIVLKDCSTKKGFEGLNYVRITVRNRKDNQRFLAALKSIQEEIYSPKSNS